MRSRTLLDVGLAIVMIATIIPLGTAKGTMVYTSKGKNIKTTFTHAFLIKGPDGVDPSKTVRRLLLTTADIGPKLKTCETMSCVDQAFAQGLQVDWDLGPRLNYWLTLNDQTVQFSGTTDPKAFTPMENQDTRLGGRLSFDATAAGGPKVDVEFDATLLKEIKKGR